MSRIMLIEKYQTLQGLISDELLELGHHVMVFSDPPCETELFHRLNPDLVILGVTQTGEAWRDVIQLIRRADYNLPVILYSSFIPSRSDPAVSMADYVVLKGVRLDELLEKIDRSLQANENPWACPGMYN